MDFSAGLRAGEWIESFRLSSFLPFEGNQCVDVEGSGPIEESANFKFCAPVSRFQDPHHASSSIRSSRFPPYSSQLNERHFRYIDASSLSCKFKSQNIDEGVGYTFQLDGWG